ncbi:MAG: hypothetical protein HRT67_09165 [Flavobacteriaceae bacterium]|nr:hypothetical protein [Flavobacteriaceae bacterium]
MRHFIYILSVFCSIGSLSFASTQPSTTHSKTSFVTDYGNSFIFVEQGVEFAVFPDGQFDFNVECYAPNYSANLNFNGASISFNTGHSYDAYVQYDDFGAVIQIENVPIYYDYFGRITQAGDVRIRYNRNGYIRNVGGLYIHYNRYNNYSHSTGFINIYNRHYVYRPWHSYYVIPRVDLCVLFGTPYRQYYTPIRHTYYRPYRNNFRPRISSHTARRDRRITSRTRRSDRYRQQSPTRRSNSVASTSRPKVRHERDTKFTRRDGVNSQSRPMVRNDRNRGIHSKPMISRTERNNRIKPHVNAQQRQKITQSERRKTKRTISRQPQSSTKTTRTRRSTNSQRRMATSPSKRKQTLTRSSSR